MGIQIVKNAIIFARGSYTSAEDLVRIIKGKLDSIRTPGDVTAWMDICRTARQPQMLWHVDYIEPRDSLALVNDLIRESEIVLYGDKTNIFLKEGYSADFQQQAAFNTIRAHLRSEEDDFVAALSIFKTLLDHFYDKLTPIRQSNLLMHGCLSFVCCGDFRQSHEYFKKHWILLKSLPEDQRLGLGIWDNHVILHMIYWHISANVRDFRDFYEVESGATGMMSHKKIALLKCLDYDQTWCAGFMGLPFHKQLCKLYPSFLPWEKRTTTPENYLEIWETNPGEAFRKEKEGSSPAEKIYYERYNKQFLPHTRPDEDEVENCLYSYYFFQNSKAEEVSLQDRLNMFMDKHFDAENCKQILSVGPGLAYPYQHHGRQITIVDISELVCKRLEAVRAKARRSGIHIVNKCMSKFIRDTDQTFDICMARDVLQNLSRARLDVFLNYLPKKCKHLVALIDLDADVRTDILSGSSFDQEVVLHKSALSRDEWIRLLELNFDVTYELEGSHLYVYGKSKA